jgi:hypothetical protein
VKIFGITVCVIPLTHNVKDKDIILKELKDVPSPLKYRFFMIIEKGFARDTSTNRNLSLKRTVMRRTLERHANLSTLIECSEQGGFESLYPVRTNHSPVPGLASIR